MKKHLLKFFLKCHYDKLISSLVLLGCALLCLFVPESFCKGQVLTIRLIGIGLTALWLFAVLQLYHLCSKDQEWYSNMQTIEREQKLAAQHRAAMYASKFNNL